MDKSLLLLLILLNLACLFEWGFVYAVKRCFHDTLSSAAVSLPPQMERDFSLHRRSNSILNAMRSPSDVLSMFTAISQGHSIPRTTGPKYSSTFYCSCCVELIICERAI